MSQLPPYLKHRHLVVDLYRRFLYVGRDYPLGLPYVREKVKAAFQRNADLRDEDDILRAIAKGRWWVKELIGVVQLKKYRSLRARYGNTYTDAELEARLGEVAKAAEEKRG
jgi:hypothetical protein